MWEKVFTQDEVTHPLKLLWVIDLEVLWIHFWEIDFFEVSSLLRDWSKFWSTLIEKVERFSHTCDELVNWFGNSFSFSFEKDSFWKDFNPSKHYPRRFGEYFPFKHPGSQFTIFHSNLHQNQRFLFSNNFPYLIQIKDFSSRITFHISSKSKKSSREFISPKTRQFGHEEGTRCFL
jgi:hypothetical protein